MPFLRKESCPECGSTNNVAVWLDDDNVERKRCFSAQCNFSVGYGTYKSGTLDLQAVYSPCPLPEDAVHLAIPLRGISLETAIFYDVRYSYSTTSLVFPYKRLGAVVGYKGRNVSVPKKDPRHFYSKGKLTKVLFGMQTLKNKEQRTKRLALCFGELDCLATYQMMGIPAISAANDQATLESLKANLSELEGMDTIYIIPDSDPSALPLVSAIADLLEVEVKVVSLRRFKDPNDYLMHNQVQAFRDEFYAAEKVERNYVIRGDALLEAGIAELKTNKLGVFVGCTPVDMGIGGIRMGDLTFMLGSPFAGKSTLTHYLAWKCLTVGYRVLYISVEEKPQKAIASMMRASSEVQLSSADGVDTLLSNIGDLSNLSAYANVEDLTPDILESRLKRSIRADGVQVVFIDNLTAISGGGEQQRSMMNDYIMTTRRLTSTRDVAVFWVAHTGRGSQADGMETGYGTSFIEKIADNLVGVLREADGEENGLRVEVLKCRALGKFATFRGVYDPRLVDYTWPVKEQDKEEISAVAQQFLVEQLKGLLP